MTEPEVDIAECDELEDAMLLLDPKERHEFLMEFQGEPETVHG